MTTETKTVGPFTWQREDRDGAERWALVLHPDFGVSYFCLKNYGGPPAPGFHGWKLVSGGPFDEAGGWDNVDAAMRDVAPYLVKRYMQEAERNAAKAKAMSAAAERLIKFLQGTTV